MYQIKYLEDKCFFFVEVNGKINHTHIIRFLNTICETHVENKSLLLITDYRKGIIDETSTDPIEKIGIFFNSKVKETFRHVKWASISINHLPTTGAILLNNFIKGKDVEYEPFTTLEGAFNWLDLSISDCNNLILLKEK